MAIKFRCTGCRTKLYVPTRWQGNSIDCPRCGAAVVVPPSGPGPAPTAFDNKAVEASLATLAPGPRDDAFSAAPVIFPRSHDARRERKRRDRAPAPAGADPATAAVVVSVAPPPVRRRGLRSPVTLPWWAVYAYLGLLTVCGVAAFFLGFWWASTGASGT